MLVPCLKVEFLRYGSNKKFDIWLYHPVYPYIDTWPPQLQTMYSTRLLRTMEALHEAGATSSNVYVR